MFNTANLLWGLVFSSIGLGYFIYGKKVSNLCIRVTGLALMVYPYFVANTLALVLVGLVLLFIPKFVSF